MAISIDWISKMAPKRNLLKAPSDLCDCLPKYYADIFSAVAANRQYIHNLRKNLESKFSAQKTVSIDAPGKQADKVLCLLGKTHCELASQQFKFNEVFGQELLKSLKTLEAEDESILRLGADLAKTNNELKKAQRKRADDEASSKDFTVTNLEGDKNSQTETLKSALIKYSLNESSRGVCLRAYLRQQVKFLNDCVAAADEMLTTADQIMSSNTNTKTFFGTSINEHINDRGYSEVIESCVSYLTNHECYKLQGMFREVGQMSRIQVLREAFDKRMVNDDLLNFCGHNVIGDVLKQYLRELKEPLLPKCFVDQWAAARDQMTPELAYSMVRDIPAPNQNNFIAFVRYLGKIVEHKKTSKMNPTNLSTVLCMNLFWIKPETSLSDSQIVVPIVHYLSEHCALVFKDDTSSGVLKPPTPEPSQIGGSLLNNAPSIRSSVSRTVSQIGGAPSITPHIPIRTYRTSNMETRKLPDADGSARLSKPPAPPIPVHHSETSLYQPTKEQPLTPEPWQLLTPEPVLDDRAKPYSPPPVLTESNRSSPLQVEGRDRASIVDLEWSENDEDETMEPKEEQDETEKCEEPESTSAIPAHRKSKL